LAATGEAVPATRSSHEDRDGNGEMRIETIDFVNAAGEPVHSIVTGDICESTSASSESSRTPICAALNVSLFTLRWQKPLHLDNNMTGDPLDGECVKCSCIIPRLGVVPGRYYLNAMLTGNTGMADHVTMAASIDVIDGDFFMTGRPTPANGATFFVDHRLGIDRDGRFTDACPKSHSPKFAEWNDRWVRRSADRAGW